MLEVQKSLNPVSSSPLNPSPITSGPTSANPIRNTGALEMQPDVLQIKPTLIVPTPFKTADAPEIRTQRDTPQPRSVSPPPTMPVSMKMPLLAIAAGGSMLAAIWSYTTLDDTRSQLTTMTEAKATVDRSLADARARLLAAEKAVADVKAALTTAPAVVAPPK
jgi:hypothetical protein